MSLSASARCGHGNADARPRDSHRKNQISESVVAEYAHAEATAAPVSWKGGISIRSSTTVVSNPTAVAAEFTPGRPMP